MNKNELLICTDLDRTLIPNGVEAESANARKLFSYLSSLEQITLVYVTGRDIHLVDKAINTYQLPRSDYVISDVGASIYRLNNQNIEQSSQWQYLSQWEEIYKQSWMGKKGNDLAQLFYSIKDLRRQEYSKQKAYKLSYYLPLYSDHLTIIAKMKEILSQEKIEAEFIWSIDAPNNIGLLDVMPKNATKKNAIEYLMHIADFNLENTIFSGDSGNDIDVLLSSIKSTLVANAHPDIKQQVLTELNNDDHSKNIYIANGDFLQMNGNYSAGILEGICHYFPSILTLLTAQQKRIENDSR
ncbi:MAG: HAD-IIB family hydrolase [Gammaproteobacteria bacterium]|nr:HAD-IIB family hydrolase [Gammaproteobacteria bacterium]